MGKTMKYKGICSAAALAVAVTAFGGGAPATAQLPPRITLPPVPAPPSPPEPSLPKGTPVRVSFAPPLGVPIRYRLTDRRTEDGSPKVKILELVVRFDRSDGQYRMEGRVEFPGLPPHLAANPTVRIALQPIIFRLDQDGGLTGIENEEAYWASLDGIIDDVARASGSPPNLQDFIRKTFDTMRAMPTAERAALVGRNFAPITARASFDLAVGESFETPPQEATVPFPIANPKIKQRFKIVLASATPSTARIETDSRLDAEDLARVMRQLMELGPKNNSPPGLPQIRQTFVHVVSRETGLTIRSTETIRAVGEDSNAPADKSATLERIDQH